MQASHDWRFSCAIVGATRSGKTCLMRALLGESFSPLSSSSSSSLSSSSGDGAYYQTLGAEFATIESTANGESVAVDMTCLPGTWRLLPLTQLHLRDKLDAVVVVYAVNSVDSFKETPFWVNEASRMAPGCLIVLVGTHADKSFKVNGADALMQAKVWGGRAYTLSSKTCRGVDEFKDAFFMDLVRAKGHVV